MISFLKGLLKGFLYVLFFPFGLLSIALYGIFGIFVFIFQFFKLIYLFFTGRSFKNELKEDIEVKSILDANSNKEEEKTDEPALTLYPSDAELYKTDYVSPTFENEKKPEVEDKPSIEEEEKEYE